MRPLADLLAEDAQTGRVTWIGLRPARRADVQPIAAADLTESGLDGDHARPGKRALTLFQDEHLAAIAGYLGQALIAPERLRRNLHVSGLNLSALRGATLAIGDRAIVTITGPCAPCSRMTEAFGPGGYNALRGHGGWCASIVRSGPVSLGDSVRRA